MGASSGGGVLPLGGVLPPGGPGGANPPGLLLLRAVRILLECILVQEINTYMFCARKIETCLDFSDSVQLKYEICTSIFIE